MPETSLTTLSGPALLAHLPALARLRIEVFRAWPYLYEGDLAYEERYCRVYAERPGAAVVLALSAGEVVGASTCLPLSQEPETIQAPFIAAGLNPAEICYFGESVLLPGFRGQGLGVGFFQGREAAARAWGAKLATFCAVQRAPEDPRRPPGYTPLDEFWRHRGFTPRPDLICTMSWREIGAAQQSANRLMFWTKPL
ncbi:GNAT family N-acetyltransferase [Acidocella sp.]|uniref:GNAT family N-acetyltransferase n=1 Tax=Acidocella sp. TaxID=50710 RepID=UPI002622CCCF|nr:GNAT family N-acetyltransferase [Acidocella sp.]